MLPMRVEEADDHVRREHRGRCFRRRPRRGRTTIPGDRLRRGREKVPVDVGVPLRFRGHDRQGSRAAGTRGSALPVARLSHGAVDALAAALSSMVSRSRSRWPKDRTVHRETLTSSTR